MEETQEVALLESSMVGQKRAGESALQHETVSSMPRRSKRQRKRIPEDGPKGPSKTKRINSESKLAADDAPVLINTKTSSTDPPSSFSDAQAGSTVGPNEKVSQEMKNIRKMDNGRANARLLLLPHMKRLAIFKSEQAQSNPTTGSYDCT